MQREFSCSRLNNILDALSLESFDGDLDVISLQLYLSTNILTRSGFFSAESLSEVIEKDCMGEVI